LQILHRQEATGLEFAFDKKIFDPLAGQIEKVQSIAPALNGRRGISGNNVFLWR
jgi:hypothetical protein